MTLFQILAALFGLWMLYEVSIYAKKKILVGVEIGLWVGLWILFISLALFPNLLLGIAHGLKFTRVFDLLLVGALMVLTVLIFLSYFTQKENTRRLRELVSQLAIKEVTPPKRKKTS